MARRKDMGMEAGKQVSQQEIALQYQYMDRLRERNERIWKQTGKQPLALVQTYGCQQNENDSERLRGMLARAGYGFCESVQQADVIIFNTCAIRENAELRVFGNLGALKHEKRRRPELVIGVCGCMMQQPQVVEQICRKYKHVELVFGTHTLYQMPQLLLETLESHRPSVCVYDMEGQIAEDMPVRREAGVKAYVSVMYGCNNFCSYCIVPYVRGRERSRRPEDIMRELEEAAHEGYREVMLLGQNVNSYGKDLELKMGFAQLIELAAQVDGIERIRFMTSHPKDFNDELISAMASNRKVCTQLHLPVQAGSDKVLADMNRRYTRKEYLEKIKKVRSAIPNLAVTSDIIVGFPTETEEDFEQTLSLLEEVRFDSVYSFIYSKRSGTAAARMAPVLNETQIHQYFDRLLEVQNRISKEINDTYLEGVYQILVEGKSKSDEHTLTGRTSSGKIVNFVGDEASVGQLIDVKITGSQTWSLFGEVVS